MGRAYSNDLRKPLVRAVIKGGLSCHQAAAQFDVAVSTAINWVRRFRETGNVEPDQIGGYRPKKISGEHRDWLIRRCRCSTALMSSSAKARHTRIRAQLIRLPAGVLGHLEGPWRWPGQHRFGCGR